MTETVLTNARVVLPGGVMHGSVTFDEGTRDDEGRRGEGRILGVDGARRGEDVGGDYVIAGIVDLHTDNLERQVEPRTGARWPSRSALVTHDAQCAAAGVTTVLDALCVGDLGFDHRRIRTLHDGLADLAALSPTGLLKAEHFLHLRCELPAPDLLELFEASAGHGLLRMVSLMDHSPGVGQNANIERYRGMRRRDGLGETEIDSLFARLAEQRERLLAPNRRALLDRARRLGVALASHDDRTEAEIAVNVADGIGISEFPVTLAAARAARAAGMQVIAGAPNIVRGGSHSGNVAAAELLAEGVVDALASDYVPASLVEAAFLLGAGPVGLPAAVAMVTDNPARMAGFRDRGRIEPGLRADLARVAVHDGLAVVRQVWRAGQRVA